MHWFWRLALSSLVGSIAFPFLFYLFLFGGMARGSWNSIIGVTPAVCCALSASCFLILENRHRGRESHCRNCDCILRGLSEPRCPTCRELI
jgi:hypothetical protein